MRSVLTKQIFWERIETTQPGLIILIYGTAQLAVALHL